MEEQQRGTPRNIKVGNARVIKIGRQYEELGYKVIFCTGNHEGPDLVIVSTADATIRKVIECTNYNNPKQLIPSDHFDRYMGTLGYWENMGIELELIVSYMSNVTAYQLSECQRLRIKVTAVGPQDQPEDENVEGWVE